MALIRPPLPQLAFTMIPNAWVRDGNLRPNAKAVLADLLSHAEGYRLSTAQIMRETGLGRDGVDAAIDHMLARGYLVSVEQRQGERGRFTENDYTVTSCTDRVPPIPANPPKRGRKVGIGPQRSETAPVLPGTGPTVNGGDPPLEEQGEKNTPDPSDQGAIDGDGRHLRAVEDEESKLRDKVAQTLAAEHYEATGKLGGSRAFLGLRGIVARALEVGHAEAAIRAALAHLRQRGRPVTNATLGPLLADPRTATSSTYGPRQPIPTDPDAHRGAF